MLGNHAANNGGKPALIANVADMVWNKMYPNDSANPTPRYTPMPPFRFLAESEAPMMVRMKDANDEAIRL